MSLRTLIIISLLVTFVGAFFLLRTKSFVIYGDQFGYEPVQPINFSHKIHAGDNKINCMYCHSNADKSKAAGVPSVATCMNCHSKIYQNLTDPAQKADVEKIYAAINENKPIEWVKVNDVPDFVTFNHSRHVTANISCQTCHGPVETVERVSQQNTFTMSSCVNCHRTYNNMVIDENGQPQPAAPGDPKVLKPSTDCAVCHH